MPIYEYTCKQCNGKFDQLVRTMGGEPKVKCPACGSERTARNLSVFAVSSASGKGPSSGEAPTCGRCGGLPGSCQMG